MVELTSGRLRWVPAAASARQPAAVVSAIATLSIPGFRPKAGVRASTSRRRPISALIATHLQLHLAITKMIPARPLESTEEVLYAMSMIKIPVETPAATLRYG